MPRTLPEFRNPPLVEVALGVQFEELPLQTPHIGLLWQRYRERFPHFEEWPPLAAVSETDIGTKVQKVLIQASSLPRLWFVNQRKDRLIQVQSNRFLLNWRRRENGDEYPRYERLAESFAEAFAEFGEFLASERLGVIAPNQWEVTYVNHIRSLREIRSNPCDAYQVFPFIAKPIPTGNMASEGLKLIQSYPIRREDGLFVGRLHVDLETVRVGGEPIFRFHLTARGITNAGDAKTGQAEPSGPLESFFDIGHRTIVRAFSDLTTKLAHESWGRIQ